MKTFCGSVRSRFLGLSPHETSFRKRGFRGSSPATRTHLEQLGETFILGFNTALESDSVATTHQQLARVDSSVRGFAFEGAAMAMALLDRLTPWRRDRVKQFLAGPGHAHAYMIHVGVGWVWARLRSGFRKQLADLDPLLRWLAFDGWGFHDCFFKWRELSSSCEPPARLIGYERRVYDQGFGRALWFANGADVELISQYIAGFPQSRRADLWSGVGLAATYAGGVDEAALELLKERARNFLPAVAQGAAFAAKARQRAENISGHTELASRILCGLSADAAARVTDSALENLPTDSAEPAYEIWRRRIQNCFTHTQHLQEA